jgi:hypothetical protein
MLSVDESFMTTSGTIGTQLGPYETAIPLINVCELIIGDLKRECSFYLHLANNRLRLCDPHTTSILRSCESFTAPISHSPAILTLKILPIWTAL